MGLPLLQCLNTCCRTCEMSSLRQIGLIPLTPGITIFGSAPDPNRIPFSIEDGSLRCVNTDRFSLAPWHVSFSPIVQKIKLSPTPFDPSTPRNLLEPSVLADAICVSDTKWCSAALREALPVGQK